MPMRRLIAIVLLLAATAAPVRAQGAGSALEDSLARLSEILGALHYLRGICAGNEGKHRDDPDHFSCHRVSTPADRETGLSGADYALSIACRQLRRASGGDDRIRVNMAVRFHTKTRSMT